MATFEGEYQRGGPGVTTMPIPVLGRGSLSVDAEGLTVVGTRKHRSALFVISVAIAMCALAFAVGMFSDPSTLGRGSGKLKVGTVIGLALGAIGGAIVTGRGKLVPWRFTVPWRCVRELAVTRGTEIVVTINRMSPKGTLHFVPDNGPQQLHAALLAGSKEAS